MEPVWSDLVAFLPKAGLVVGNSIVVPTQRVSPVRADDVTLHRWTAVVFAVRTDQGAAREFQGFWIGAEEGAGVRLHGGRGGCWEDRGYEWYAGI
jgi:hypothetical protein